MTDNNLNGKGILQAALLNSLKRGGDNPAMCFGDTCFSYRQMCERVSRLQNLFLNDQHGLQSVGIVANNDFDTYSAIIACLLSGITYVPIEPTYPDERVNYIIELSSLKSIYCSDMTTLSERFLEENHLKFLYESEHAGTAKDPFVVNSNVPAYVLFTSGTTGLPKGVPITLKNLEAFAYNIDQIGIKTTVGDRFLQVYDLAFDSSVFSYLVPLIHGACIYTLPKAPAKYALAVQMIEDKAITHVSTVPSFISYLEPYFKEIRLPSVKYWLFCGEASKTKHLTGWQKCVPDAEIVNGYGPTETTIICSGYRCNINAIKDRNGIVCIGKPFEGTFFALFDEGNHITGNGIIAELCIAGLQLTAGYIGNDIKNKQAFFIYNGLIYYRTGDLCSTDSDGDYFFEGRNDSQIKIDGYRIELGEIENAASEIQEIRAAVAIVVDAPGSLQIILFLVSEVQYSNTVMRDHLKKKLPDYMIPRKFIFIEKVPLNINGKIDKKSLLAIYEQSEN